MWLSAFACVCRAVLDDDVPGGGRHFCVSCSRYFITDGALLTHERSKPHKRRLKELTAMREQGVRPHTQADAERAGGMGPADNGQRAAMMVDAAPVAMLPRSHSAGCGPGDGVGSV